MTPGAPRKKRCAALDPRQTNLMLPIRGDRSRADGRAPAAVRSAAGATVAPVDNATYREALAAALEGEHDDQIARWARGTPRAAKNWRLKINGADAPALIELSKPGRSKAVRAWLLDAVGAVEPQKNRKAG